MSSALVFVFTVVWSFNGSNGYIMFDELKVLNHAEDHLRGDVMKIKPFVPPMISLQSQPPERVKPDREKSMPGYWTAGDTSLLGLLLSLPDADGVQYEAVDTSEDYDIGVGDSDDAVVLWKRSRSVPPRSRRCGQIAGPFRMFCDS
ncbi:uncharacterized protein LOC128230229 [Mya arenaria]|nr:uncharacterized protein LOC128230229 [Mya arenaria]